MHSDHKQEACTPSVAQVKAIAHMAKLEIAPEQLEGVRRELSSVLQWFSALQSVDTTGVEPLANPIEGYGWLREDMPSPSGPRELFINNGPETVGDYFLIPSHMETGH